MSVIKSNMAAIAIYMLYQILMHGDPQIFMIAIYVFVFQIDTLKIFQNLNHRNIV